MIYSIGRIDDEKEEYERLKRENEMNEWKKTIFVCNVRI